MDPAGVSPYVTYGNRPHSFSGTAPGQVLRSQPEGVPPAINVKDLLTLKLTNPEKQLNFEESIALLTHCISEGEREAKHANMKELIVLIGNTGAGKSTFGNYASGCTMKRVNPLTLGIKGIDNVVVVKSVKEGGILDEIMPIGHTKQSMTFMPQIATAQNGVTFCDCPGFLDNRGVEINIANAVNIKKAFGKAQCVKVIILINYHTLKADRSRGLNDMIKICCDLFGSRENLIRYQESILLGITSIPRAPAREDDDDPLPTLDNLKDWIASTEMNDGFSHETLVCLSRKLFIYDPLDNPNLQYSGAWNKPTILNHITQLTPINQPHDIFQTVLTPQDRLGLVNICEEIERQIHSVFGQQKLTENDFKKIAGYQKSLNQLEIIEHPQVNKLITKARGTISSNFKKMITEFERNCLEKASNLTQESENTLNQLKSGIRLFDQEIQMEVGIAEFEKRYLRYKKKFEAKEIIQSLRQMERTFRSDCDSTNFSKAEATLNQMKVKVLLLDNEYKDIDLTDLGNDVQFDRLKGVLHSAKERHNKRLNEEKKRDEEIAALKKAQKEEIERRNREAEAARKAAAQKAEEDKRKVAEAKKKAEEEARKKAEAKKKVEEGEAAKMARRAVREASIGLPRIQSPMDLRFEIVGPGLTQIVATPMGPALSTANGLFPVIFTNLAGVVINHPTGVIMIQTQGGAFRGTWNPFTGFVPFPT